LNAFAGIAQALRQPVPGLGALPTVPLVVES
jgi:hypothetical protein